MAEVFAASEIMDKLTILSDAAKYDVACTSSGTDRGGDGKNLGNAAAWYMSYFYRRWQMYFPA